MTDKKTEALRLALEALVAIGHEYICQATHHKKKDQHGRFDDCPNAERHQKAITAIREALAEQPAPQQEPVAWIDICEKGQMSGLRYWSEPDNRHEVPLYTSPPAQQQEPVAVIRSVVHSGDGGVRVTWLGGFPQIGDLLYTSPPASKPHEQQEPVACKTLCELCVKRGYHFCANAAQTTPIPSPPANKPWVGLTDADLDVCDTDGRLLARYWERVLREKNT